MTLAGNYRVIEKLGAGGMAVVYKAKQLSIDRIVALKTLKQNDPHVMERFYREVQTLSKLRHPSIVEAIDAVRTETGQTFLVMEYVDGVTLESLINDAGPIDSPQDFATLVCQICDALDHAHGQRIIHRDLKPANVVMVVDETTGEITAKVLDFGIAKLQDDFQKLTREGQAMGSPLYMSPEQCMGQDLSPASDVYSLGVVAYQMATGQLPYQSSNIVQVMSAHCDPKVFPQPISELRPDLPGVNQLNQIINTALETNLDNRFQTAADLKRAISFWIQMIQKGESEKGLPEELTRVAAPSKSKKKNLNESIHDLTAYKRSQAAKAKKAELKTTITLDRGAIELNAAPKTVAAFKMWSLLIFGLVFSIGLATLLILNLDNLENGWVEASRSLSTFMAPPKPAKNEVKEPETTSKPSKPSDTSKASDDSSTPSESSASRETAKPSENTTPDEMPVDMFNGSQQPATQPITTPQAVPQGEEYDPLPSNMPTPAQQTDQGSERRMIE
jgi:Serine/threonine protein kinase